MTNEQYVRLNGKLAQIKSLAPQYCMMDLKLRRDRVMAGTAGVRSFEQVLNSTIRRLKEVA